VPTLTGVLGFPVAHSRSPAMQNAAFRALGLDWRYLFLPSPPALFDEIVRALPASGFAGANVTVPHKLAAHALADELSAAAAAIGAVNTLTFRDGRILGDNTDAAGLLDAIGEPVSGRRALVLGAGGAGRAAAWALREAGAEVEIWNRTAERAAAVAEELGVGHADRPGEDVEVLVNATSVGLEHGRRRRESAPAHHAVLGALGLAGRTPPPVVVDFVYAAGQTALCNWAEEGGARVVDGLEVLVCQGARSLALWTSAEPPLEAMRTAAIQR
jgi:shikimate dehydrogenase